MPEETCKVQESDIQNDVKRSMWQPCLFEEAKQNLVEIYPFHFTIFTIDLIVSDKKRCLIKILK